LRVGLSNSLPIGGLWCELCKTPRHDPCHCPMMQKYQTMPKSTLCNFYKSVGHEDKDFRTMELIKEGTSYAYRMLAELMTGPPAQEYNNVKHFVVPPKYNKVPWYNRLCTDNEGNIGGKGRGGFERGR
jgi:hypothetical protein